MPYYEGFGLEVFLDEDVPVEAGRLRISLGPCAGTPAAAPRG